jgi:hypothetical protein
MNDLSPVYYNLSEQGFLNQCDRRKFICSTIENNPKTPLVACSDNGTISHTFLSTELQKGDKLFLNIWAIRDCSSNDIDKLLSYCVDGITFKGYTSVYDSQAHFRLGTFEGGYFDYLTFEEDSYLTLSPKYSLNSFIWKVVRDNKVIQISGGRHDYLKELVYNKETFPNKEYDWRKGEFIQSRKFYRDKSVYNGKNWIVGRKRYKDFTQEIVNELIKMGVPHKIEKGVSLLEKKIILDL